VRALTASFDQEDHAAAEERRTGARQPGRRRAGDPEASRFARSAGPGAAPVYGALDLGTNNCRLLLAMPEGESFRVVDAFSRIIRLGEGVYETRRLSEKAMARTIDALSVCTDKLARRNVTRSRLIATEACRFADNGGEFIERVRRETGLRLEVISRETEAQLAVAGCAALLDPGCSTALVFDIGGGSSELMLVEIRPAVRTEAACGRALSHRILAWTSLPVGVVTLAERYGGIEIDRPLFERMIVDVAGHLAPFRRDPVVAAASGGPASMHFLGTSGTVTTIAGIHMRLRRYDRSRVDGCWLDSADATRICEQVLAMGYEGRIRSPCIGRERADLVLAGCAILEAIIRAWQCARIRVADRGLREGILSQLMSEDGYLAPRPDALPPNPAAAWPNNAG
jgi:exopolyphosphatase/guanosine-5'-triphosphate,3'-diphosphate pyrophosphatase